MYMRTLTPQNIASHSEKHFTLMGFTALTGEPVMCVIIIKGKERSAAIETGIDVLANVVGEPTDNDYFKKIRGRGAAGPREVIILVGGRAARLVCRPGADLD